MQHLRNMGSFTSRNMDKKNICILTKKLFLNLVVIFPKHNLFRVNLMHSLKIKMILNLETM